MTRPLETAGSGASEWPKAQERRRLRSPETLHLIELLGRFVEWSVVVITGLAITYLTYFPYDLGSVRAYVQVVWLSSVSFAVLAELVGVYDPDTRFSLRNGWTRITIAWTASCIALVLTAFLLRQSEDFSRAWSLTVYGVTLGTLILARTVGTLALLKFKATGVFDQRLAVFGDERESRELCRRLAGDDQLTIEVVGCYGVMSAQDGVAPRLSYRGDATRLLSDVRRGRIDQVIIALPFSDPDLHRKLVSELSAMPVLIRLSPDLGGYAFTGQSLVVLGGLPLATLFEKPINGADIVWKRLEDIVLGALILLAIAPAIALAALIIKLDSPGPVFFRQRREGFNNRSFRIWKLRTMHVDTLQFDDVEQARKGDRRVTRVGRILRATSLDELPQLFNVLRGDMSLVGPRPHAPSTRVRGVLFHQAVQNYAARHRVKPGMTGWAQVHGWRGETDTDDKLRKRVEHDLYYIEHWSIGFDIYILFRTFGAVLFPRSAH